MTTIRTTIHFTPEARAILEARGPSLSEATNAIVLEHQKLLERLTEIGEFANARSYGAAEDDLWEVRRMAYEFL